MTREQMLNVILEKCHAIRRDLYQLEAAVIHLRIGEFEEESCPRSGMSPSPSSDTSTGETDISASTVTPQEPDTTV